ncbi:MAG: LacI family DNA-binding transcriptional regulator [Stackebrandtia sp.]
MVTISDVAERAQASTATVSRVLNGVATVSPVLAERVLTAAKDLGYQRNGLARSLRRQATAVIALIISDVENRFFTSIARGVEDAAQVEGYSVVLCNSDEDADKERRYLDVAVQERVAGVIISPTAAEGNVDVLRDRGIPVVAVDRPLPGFNSDRVLVDTRAAAHEATAHLAAQGYRRIGLVTGPSGIPTADDRLAGYLDGLRTAGLRAGQRLVRRAPYRLSGGKAAVGELFALAEPPDALLIANSIMAIGALEALSSLNLRSGRDVGVVAFDDAPWATLLDPPLSVVAQPAYDIGGAAARLLLARIADNGRAPITTTLSAALIPRASSTRG